MLTVTKKVKTVTTMINPNTNETPASPFHGKLIDEQTRSAIQALVDHVRSDLCNHENSHVVGMLWEVCHDCTAKATLADGGLKPTPAPQTVVDAENLLAGCIVADHCFEGSLRAMDPIHRDSKRVVDRVLVLSQSDVPSIHEKFWNMGWEVHLEKKRA